MQCPKCTYVRQEFDVEPETECPSCGVLYAKATSTPKKRSLKAAKKGGILDAVLAAGLLAIAFSGWGIYQWIQARSDRNKTFAIEMREPKYGTWSEQINGDIVKTMGAAGMAGHWSKCGVIKWASDSNHTGRYLVRCSTDGSEWAEYEVDTRKGSMRGPNFPKPEHD